VRTHPNLPPSVSDVVEEYVTAVDVATDGLVEAVYLVGSVALGDFQPGSSDIDFVAVTSRPLDSATADALRGAHAGMSVARRRPYVDGVYVTWDDLRGDPAKASPGAAVHEHRWRRGGGTGNPVTWHELAWHGIAVCGPDRRDIDVWTDPARLVRWNRDNMAAYWRPWHARARRPVSKLGIATLGSWAPAWGVLGVARQSYTIDTGRITSKFGAGLYAREVFPLRWHRIIDECLRIRGGSAGQSAYADPVRRRRDALDFMDLAMTEILGSA
jgi:hypothetical protein